MNTLFDYIFWRGDLSVEQSPINEVDGLIFAALSYIKFNDYVPEGILDGVTIRDLAYYYRDLPKEELIDAYRCEKDLELLERMSQAPRYQSMRISANSHIISNDLEAQFAAFTVEISKNTHMIVFRGTDESLIGWKEDLNLSFLDSTAGQRLASEYLNYVALKTHGKLYISGHSKGGNFAVFSAASAPSLLQKRIACIWNYDGPGFREEFLSRPGYQAILPKVHTLVPQSSVVGMLLEHEEPYTVVESGNIGLLQHDPYSWKVMGPTFVTNEEVDESSRITDTSIRMWLSGLSPDDREKFVDAVHQIILETHATKLSDLAKPQNIMQILKVLGQSDEDTKNMIVNTLGALGKSMSMTLKDSFKAGKS